MLRRASLWTGWSLWLALALAVTTSSGCVGLAAQIMYMFKGDKIEAEYAGLKKFNKEKKRVAVVCVTKSGYGGGRESEAVARVVSAILRKEYPKLDMVRHTEIEEWIDTNDWDYINYKDIAKGVKADMLIAIDLSSISYYDGATLYKGRANYTVTAYDMTDGGAIVYKKPVPDYNFPAHGGRPVTDMVEAKFQQIFLTMLAQDIARTFYDYERIDGVVQDASLLGE